MDNLQLYQDASTLIIDDFELNAQALTKAFSYEDLIQQLIPIVEHFINYEIERFLFILYKIDVDEQQTMLALINQEKKPSLILSELILNRILSKAKTRLEYRNKFQNIPEEDRY